MEPPLICNSMAIPWHEPNLTGLWLNQIFKILNIYIKMRIPQPRWSRRQTYSAAFVFYTLWQPPWPHRQSPCQPPRRPPDPKIPSPLLTSGASREHREPGTDEHSMLAGIGILGVLLYIYSKSWIWGWKHFPFYFLVLYKTFRRLSSGRWEEMLLEKEANQLSIQLSQFSFNLN